MIKLFVLICVAVAYNVISNTTCKSAYCSDCESSEGSCTSCIDYFILQDGNCVWYRDLNCDESDDSKCTGCDTEYTLTSDNTCISCSSKTNCTKIDGNDCDSTCLDCESGFYLNENSECVSDDVHCSYYDETNTCSSCTRYYYLNDDGNCTRGEGDKYCEKFEDSTGVCTSCENGYTLNLDTYECVGPKSIDENCIEIEFDLNDKLIKCVGCDTNYQVTTDGDGCLLCNISNCGTCDYSTGDTICSSCESGYYETDDGFCVSCGMEGCDECANANSCTICSDGYYYNNDDYECAKCPGNCTDCARDAETKEFYCYDCEDGFSLINFECFECNVNHCKTCNSTDSSIHNICEECEDNYFITEDGKSCEPCSVDGCSLCDGDKDTCGTCISGIEPNEDGSCVICPDNCAQCNEDGTKCEKCSTGYFITENFKCSACSEDCSGASITSDGDICVYYSHWCIINEKDGCYFKSSDGESCIYCDDGHTLVDGKCYYYEAIKGSDEVDYVCVQYSDRAEEIFEEGDYTTVIYDPVDGVCANPFPAETSSESDISNESNDSNGSTESESGDSNNEDNGYDLTIVVVIGIITLLL
ncbi:Gal/GalNAc lectin Igl2 [Entamoeba marina]